MRDQIASDRTYRNAYEMTIYDPARDAGKVSNRQCLSFLSFKLTHDKALLLTVMYRNHAYVARGLGNFLGSGDCRHSSQLSRGPTRIPHLHLDACGDRCRQEDQQWHRAGLDDFRSECANHQVPNGYASIFEICLLSVCWPTFEP